jgi:hypothetical protein
MYLDALEFLEEEREAWRPYEALLDLDDASLSRPVEAAHGWSGRDLMGHLLAWQEVALRVATELAVGESAPSIAALDADWDARGGDLVNAELQARWAAVALDQLRTRFRSLPGELRGYLTVVPESRWIKHPTNMSTFVDETINHYAEHLADLGAILAAA